MSIVEILKDLQESAHEKFAVFYHTSKGVYGHILAEGEVERVAFSSRKIIEAAQRVSAHAISVAHNHPYGPVRPSNDDLVTTFKLQDLLKANGMKLHDHVIVGKEGSPFSMLKEGVI